MARLTNLASVLAALDSPADYRDASRSEETAQRREPAPPVVPPEGIDARSERPGYQIWESSWRQAEFYAAYAEMLETDRRRHEGHQARRAGRQRWRVAARPRADGDTWVPEAYPSREWVGPAALATCYRLAAQHAMLVDRSWATRLAARAGMAYVAAGLPFGLFLLAGLLDDQTLRQNDDVIEDAVRPFAAPDASDAVRHPVQLTYLTLAASSRPWLRSLLGEALNHAEQQLASRDLYPIGPQGVPLGEYVDLATAMRYQEGPAAARAMVGRLASLNRTQAASLRAAQRNRYLWRRGASPVNIIDLEHVALSGLALRHQPSFSEMSDALTAELDRDDELAQLPVWTMREIESELQESGSAVTDIMRAPERAWRTADFHAPDIQADPWSSAREDESPAHRGGEGTRPDFPATRPDAPGTLPDLFAPGYPGSAYPRNGGDYPGSGFSDEGEDGPDDLYPGDE
jgi:hypothetical protein